jgi:hypothetical protein
MEVARAEQQQRALGIFTRSRILINGRTSKISIVKKSPTSARRHP